MKVKILAAVLITSLVLGSVAVAGRSIVLDGDKIVREEEPEERDISVRALTKQKIENFQAAKRKPVKNVRQRISDRMTQSQLSEAKTVKRASRLNPRERLRDKIRNSVDSSPTDNVREKIRRKRGR